MHEVTRTAVGISTNHARTLSAHHRAADTAGQPDVTTTRTRPLPSGPACPTLTPAPGHDEGRPEIVRTAPRGAATQTRPLRSFPCWGGRQICMKSPGRQSASPPSRPARPPLTIATLTRRVSRTSRRRQAVAPPSGPRPRRSYPRRGREGREVDQPSGSCHPLTHICDGARDSRSRRSRGPPLGARAPRAAHPRLMAAPWHKTACPRTPRELRRGASPSRPARAALLPAPGHDTVWSEARRQWSRALPSGTEGLTLPPVPEHMTHWPEVTATVAGDAPPTSPAGLAPTNAVTSRRPGRRLHGGQGTDLPPPYPSRPDRQYPDDRHPGPGASAAQAPPERRAPNSDARQSSRIPACTPARGPVKHRGGKGNGLPASDTGLRAAQPANPRPPAPAPCDTPPRAGPRGTGLFSRRCAWATNRPCDGRYPTR